MNPTTGKIATLLAFGFVLGCTPFKQISLYDVEPLDNRKNVSGFYAVSIYQDQITNDLWHTDKTQCITVKKVSEEKHSGDNCLEIKWNKQADGCNWIGLGIGWENWTGKNLAEITSKAAISFWVKSPVDDLKSGLPWAIGFEDFSDGQAWTGVTKDCVVGGIITKDWTQVLVPLENFPFEQNDVDPSAIKQVIFQFESSGVVFMDEITIVPFQSKESKSATVCMASESITVDGLLSESIWKTGYFNSSGQILQISFDDQNLYIAAQLNDKTLLQNGQSGKDIWNGDALEIAFGTDSGSDPKRKIYYPTDVHLGIKLADDGAVYNWSSDKAVQGAQVKWVAQNSQMLVEASIPWKALEATPWLPGNTYGFEWAVDDGDLSQKRKTQQRWNSEFKEGFNTNPSLWGKVNTSVILQ